MTIETSPPLCADKSGSFQGDSSSGAYRDAPGTVQRCQQQRQSLRRGILGIAIASLALSLVALSLSLALSLSRQKGQPILRVVDVQRLIHHQSQRLVKDSPSGKVDPRRVHQAAEELRAYLEDWSHAHHILLFAKGTVWGIGEGPCKGEGSVAEGVNVTDQMMADLAKEE